MKFPFLKIDKTEFMKTILFSIYSLIAGFSFAQLYVEYNISGNYLWTRPPFVDSIKVECLGGGGGGGGAYMPGNTGGVRRGGGGGGGSYSMSMINTLSMSSYSISVGNGGIGGSFSSSGNGVFSSFGNNLVKAVGGIGGVKGDDMNPWGTGGNGGSASQNIGQVKYSGGSGATSAGCGGGGGGSSAGSSQNGLIGSNCTGGIAPFFGGNGGNGGSGSQSVLPINGQNGMSSGGGGGGGLINTPTGSIEANGGNGGDGMVKLTYYGSYISGVIFNDLNQDCIKELTENNLDGKFRLVIQPGNVVVESNNGFWWVESLPVGNYTISMDSTIRNWAYTCPLTQNFSVLDTNVYTEGPSFGLVSTIICTEPDVTIYAPFLRSCFPFQNVYVSACNASTATNQLSNSFVDMELDQLMTVTGSSLPHTILGNNIYRVETGTINPGECVNFSLSTTISCDATLNHTFCLKATLNPAETCIYDTSPSGSPIGAAESGGTLNGLPQPCTLPWDQSSLSVDGWCANDSIYFTITNTGEPGGGDMECYSPMWITVDGVVTYTDSIMIPGGETVTLVYPGDGQTWILNAEQHPLHPGNSHPNAHVEACGDTTNWTPDNVNDFPLDDADPIVDIYCGLVTGSYDPNDKTGYPNGFTDQYYIQPNQQLQYVIRFQNTGTDTAFTVVIRDTLDTDLNIFTVTPGVSSHNYEFRMYGPRVLEWTFNNILLPDSTTNEPESNGFVTFHLEQVPDLAPGTEITNDADIYFDFNDPITTNTTMHRIYEGFVAVAHLEEMSKETSGLSVYPNPSNGQFTLLLDKEGPENYSLYDQQGRVVKVGSLTGKKTTIALELNNGMYYLKVGKNVTKVQVAR
jgi:uncharacterized repeat protein (TIGR01451 family)